ncbi:manganese efflux pump MntP family protein [Bacteroides sp. 224]|uniref:manganese efflux pump MntP n=1 Tax=Bacteroides sp. 224 TaxID=2302936 RepID=UPI0013D39212|nr:manganese efflux pump MntP family protein [Bacteroides sp. 224]NDV65912.1 manganese efflux pump [Bacteroides sp. 224]
MTSFEIWLIAIGVAMDCFAVSIASGIFLKKIAFRPMLTMAFFFGLFQAIMPLLGWLGGSTLSHLIASIDHWIAFCILTFLGLRMVRESLKEEDCKQGLNPASLKIILTLAVATSIDALAVGVSFAFLEMNTISDIIGPIIIIGLVSFVLSIIGFIAGSCTKNACKLRADLWGGIILIIIGVKILIEHIALQ